MLMATRIIFLGLILRLLWAVVVDYRGVGVGLNGDALIFYQDAILVARGGAFFQFDVGHPALLNFLGVWMSIFSESVFSASFPGCIMWGLSGMFFVSSARLLSTDQRMIALASLLYAFWPTSIPYTATLLREAYQLAFINFAVWGALYAILKKKNLGWIAMLLGLTGAGVLHGGLAAFALIFVILSILASSMLREKGSRMGQLIFALMFAMPIFISILQIFSDTNYDFSDGTLNAVQEYQSGGIAEYSRATYKSEVYVSGSIESIYFIVYGLIQYLFEPFFWKASNFADVVLLLENTVRGLIMFIIINDFRKITDRSRKNLILYLFASFLLQELIWSLGTVNWGTASRHHVPAMGLLLLSLIATKGYSDAVCKRRLENS